MSTVIMGYTFDGSMEELLQTCLRFREKFIEVKRHLVLSNVTSGTPAYQIAERILEANRKGQRGDPFNITAAIVAYPLGRKVYVNVFDEDVHEMVRKNQKFKDFSYWNNTDRPDEVTARQWRHRERTWDKLLPDSRAVPAISGFTYDFGSGTFQTAYQIASKPKPTESAQTALQKGEKNGN